jgi:hypothetical protein
VGACTRACTEHHNPRAEHINNNAARALIVGDSDMSLDASATVEHHDAVVVVGNRQVAIAKCAYVHRILHGSNA